MDAILMKRTAIYLLLIISIITLLFAACNRTARATNRPPVIDSFSKSYSGDVVGLDTVIQVAVHFHDPDEIDNFDITRYRFSWTAQAIDPVDPGFDPADNFLVDDEQTCYWRTPDVQGFYKLTVKITDRYDDWSTGEYIVEVSEDRDPLIINSFTPSFTGSTTEPDKVINVQVNFTDPDIAGTPNPAEYSFKWTARSVEPGGVAFDPNDQFLIDDEIKCYWRTPTTHGYYRLTVEIKAPNSEPASAGFTFQVTDNLSPIITNLDIAPNVPGVNEPVTINVTAHDPDGNYPLTYEWRANRGYFMNKIENEAQWVGTSAGDAIITVKVSDALDAYIEESFIISVQDNKDPVIDGYEPLNSRPSPGETVTITIIAYDPDGDDLSYEWDATGGSFSSISANTANWVAPMEPDNYSVEVTVRDGRGGSAKIVIPFEVVP